MAQTIQTPLIQKKPDLCGGNACIRNTRIPVWTIVSFRLQGASDEELLSNYPGLEQQDLDAVWAYYAENPSEIDLIIDMGND
jgi:type III restriction enzyme